MPTPEPSSPPSPSPWLQPPGPSLSPSSKSVGQHVAVEVHDHGSKLVARQASVPAGAGLQVRSMAATRGSVGGIRRATFDVMCQGVAGWSASGSPRLGQWCACA